MKLRSFQCNFFLYSFIHSPIYSGCVTTERGSSQQRQQRTDRETKATGTTTVQHKSVVAGASHIWASLQQQTAVLRSQGILENLQVIEKETSFLQIKVFRPVCILCF